MRSILLATTAVFVALTSAASAADLSLIPSGHITDSWTGLYVGGNVGYDKGTLEERPQTIGPNGPFADISPKGWSWGGQVGYNHQFGMLVVGLETDFQVSRGSGSRTINWTPKSGPKVYDFEYAWSESQTERHGVKMPWFGTSRVRLGFTPWQSLLVYGTGGVAYGKITMSDEYEYSHSSPWYSYHYGSRTTTDRYGVGYAVGGGLEWAFAHNWTAKVEYLHLDLKIADMNMTSTYDSMFNSTRATDELLRVGLNYKF